MPNGFGKFSVYFFLALAFLIFPFFIFAADPPPECVSGSCCEADGKFSSADLPCEIQSEFSCLSGADCGGDVGQRDVIRYCSGASADCEGRAEYGDWSISQDCQSWQVCSPGTLSCSSCVGDCLTADVSLPFPGDTDVKLPVTLGWDRVNGANSYRYKINGLLEDQTTSTNVPIDEEGACLLRSNADYNWGVQACCGLNGNDCGPWSNWNFKTSSGPQLLSPRNGEDNVPLPAALDWCDVEGSQFYLLRTFVNNLCHPFFFDETTGACLYFPVSEEKRGGEPGPVLHSDFTDPIGMFAKDNKYDWELATCFDEQTENCVDYGKKQVFFTGEGPVLTPPELKTPLYNPAEPDGIPAVNQLDSLSWQGSIGTLSYQIIIERDGRPATIVKKDSLSLPLKEIGEIWNNPEDFNAVYSWRVKPCWDGQGENCENAESASWRFKTTGKAPGLFSPASGASAKIPANLTWENVPGAASYAFQVAEDENFVSLKKNATSSIPKTLVGPPELSPDSHYWWRVKTCADLDALACGDWSEIRDFSAFPLNPPINPSPEKSLLPGGLRWDPDPGASFYQYKVTYLGNLPEETLPDCLAKQGQQIVPQAGQNPPVSSQSRFSLNEICLGDYQWRVRSCLDKDCNFATDWESSPVWNFTAITQPGSARAGLVPCGITSQPDNLDTPYNEREPCQIKHLGFLAQNIFDFLLWRLGLIILGIFSLMTGAIAYFSLGGPGTLDQIKSLWKSAGIGYLIMLLSWTLINLVMSVSGFQVQFFGRWFQLPF